MSNSHAYVRESAMLNWKTKMATLNDEAIKLFIKYDIISEDNINLLKEKGKLN